ncbi:MAG: hypothetical protein K2K44_04155, partial [Oscillospiraceae bacterium]|nr:hypothetical protein [Oscillospiraceae bacterium]
TKDGKEADTVCSVCEYKIKEGKVIPKTDHTPGDPVREDSVAATCTEDGYYNEVIKCKVCGHIISTEKKIIEKLGHTPSAAVRENVTEAKCTENGFYDEVVKCGVCNEELSRASVVLTATGHDPADIWSSDGTSHWYECRNSGCTEHISEAAHTEDGGTVTVTPDETNPGTRVYSCTVCGEELRTETIPVLEENHIHNYTIKNSDNTSHWDECVCGDKLNVSAHTPASKDEIVNEANCGRDGLKYVITYCIDCGRESGRTTAVIPQTTEHNTDGVDYTYDPAKHWKNCKVCGARQNEADHIAGPAATDTTPQTCTECGYEIAPVLAHTHTYATTWTHDDNFHWHAATCQHTDEVSGKAVHAWDSGVITTQPTETAKGVKTFTCTVCKATKTEPVSELAHTHTPSDAWRFDITGHWHVCSSCDEKVNFAAHNTVSEVTVAPTVTIPGKRRYYCSICRYVIREEVIPATGAVDVRPSTPVTAPVIPVWMNSNTASAEPVLDNGSGKSGWRSIANDIKKASNGDTVYVDMNGTTKLPKTVLRELIGKNVDLVLEMSGDITWTINGETVTKTSDANMAAKLNTNNIPAKVAEKLSEDGKVVQISLSHSGNFGFDAVMTVYLGTIYNGKYANLMYYNPASGEAEFIDCSLITNGNASLDFTHASEYAIVISDNPMGDYEDVSAAAGAFENDINVSSAAYVSIIAVIAAAMLIFRKKAIK